MEVVGSVAVEIRAELLPFRRGLDAGRKEAAAFDRTASRGFSSVASSITAMNGAVIGSQRHIRALTGAASQARTAMLGFASAAAGALAAGFSAQKVQQLIDSATRIQNALKVAGLSGDELATVYDRLFQSAQRNSAPLEALVNLYGRASQAQKTLGASTDELLGLTETVAMALRVSGASAETASGALLQLGQALSGGKVQAEEYNSIIDGLYPLLQAAAAGLKEAGGDVSKLTRLVKDGKVSSEAFFRAIEAGSGFLRDKLAGSEQTVSGAFVRLQNVMIDTARKFDDGTGASGRLAGKLNELADLIATTDLHPTINGVIDFVEDVDWVVQKLNGLVETWQNAARAFGQKIGVGRLGPALGLPQPDDDIQNRIDSAFGVSETGAKGDRPPRTATEVTVTKPGSTRPVTLADYSVPGDGDGTGKRKRENDLQREIKQIKERTAAIQAETAALAGLNPLTKDYGFAVEQASAKQELLNAAKRAGLKITPELEAEIGRLATEYAAASAAAEKLAESQEKARESMAFVKDTARGALSGMISALDDGKLKWSELGDIALDVLGRIADKLMDDAFSSGGGFLGILGSLFGFGGGGGGSSGIVPGGGFTFANGAAFSGGRVTPFAHGGIVSQPTLFPMANGAGLMGEAGPEGILPLRRNSRGQLGVMASGAGNSNQPQAVNFNMHVTVDGVGDKELEARLQKGARLEMQQALSVYRRFGVKDDIAAYEKDRRARG
ncbi:tape measure protein [Phyllobacteriaceae bacterium JZ32]